MIKDFEKKIKAYALKNALAHEGKAMQGPVISSLFNEGLKTGEVGKYAKKISEIILEVNSLSAEEQEKEFAKLEKKVHEREVREGLEELPDVDKKKGVVMRFAPSPSGPFHVGHALTFCLNLLYVKKYKGKLYLRIEDTNPENIYPKAYQMLEDEARWLSEKKVNVIIQSNRMPLYYKYAETLIEKKAAYVCTCSQKKFKEFADKKKDCPCRKLGISENMERWNKMLNPKKYIEGEAVLRFKSDMKHKNPAMRDFPLARINETKHFLQGNKYKVWPLMNLSVSVDDIELGMTHIIRGKDHRDNAERQKMIFKVFNKEYPWTFFIGRIKFTDLVLSKRKIESMIKSGEFSGHDDERLPTISSLRKRGYKPETFSKFIEQRGLTEVDKVISGKDFFEALDVFNRD